jgi:PadR family transcriptional regulator PadR
LDQSTTPGILRQAVTSKVDIVILGLRRRDMVAGADDHHDDEHERIEEHSKLYRDLLLGFVKIHILHHASREPIYGAGITAELGRHGYRLSPGTLYPLLHTLEAAELIVREDRVVDGKVRKYYRTTELGHTAFEQARLKVLELVDEISGDERSLIAVDLRSR